MKHPTFIISNVRDTGLNGIKGECEGRRVAFTFSVNLWYWDCADRKGFLDGYVEVK